MVTERNRRTTTGWRGPGQDMVTPQVGHCPRDGKRPRMPPPQVAESPRGDGQETIGDAKASPIRKFPDGASAAAELVGEDFVTQIEDDHGERYVDATQRGRWCGGENCIWSHLGDKSTQHTGLGDRSEQDRGASNSEHMSHVAVGG